MANAPPPPPPPPPPHGANPKSRNGLPDGNYDIFIIPPHSAGNGFLYLPSLKPQMNSFIAGVVSTLLVVFTWLMIQPIVKAWIHAVSSSGSGFGVLVLVLMVGFVSWTGAKTKNQNGDGSGPSQRGPSSQNGYANGSTAGGQWNPKHSANGHPHGSQNSSQGQNTGFGSTPNTQYQYPFEESPPNGSTRVPTPEPYTEDSPTGRTNTTWEKAKEETRRKEEERKRQEALKKQQEEDKRKKDAAERETRAAAEKERWEQLRAREKENRERVLREKQARERMAKSTGDCPEKEDKDRADRDARLKAAADRAERLRADRSEKDGYGRAKSEKAMPTFGVGERLDPYARESPGQRKSGRPYQQPTAQTYVGTATETGFRPYETSPRTAPNGSYYAASEDSHPRTESTAPTSPSRSYAGPYSTKDPDKVMLQGAFEFNDSFPNAPVAGVRPGENKISDGLILIFGTEGIFLNDDRRDEKLRSWDIKAWTLTAIETAHKPSFTLVRVSVMSQEKTKYVYVIPTAEKWKVDVGLKRLKGGSLFKRSTTISVMSNADANKLTTLIGL